MNYSDEARYLYLINSKKEYHELCFTELASIFITPPESKFHFSNETMDLERSIFIRGKVSILYRGDSIKEIENNMLEDDLHFDEYKITYIKHDDVPYEERLQAMRILGFAITGSFAIKDPIVKFALIKVNGKWLFGHYETNQDLWLNRNIKPYNYSHALEVKLAKSIINIAVGNNKDLSVVDPCCGIGTIIIEARAIDVSIDGYEMNRLIVNNCNDNLEYFGFNPDVLEMDMHDITKHYDVSILDLPYGQFSLITKEEQESLIKKTRDISSKSIIISMEDMSDIITKNGFDILNLIEIKKSNSFSRFIAICK